MVRGRPIDQIGPGSRRGEPAHSSGQARRRFEALRGHFQHDENDRLVVVTLRIRLAQDHWLGRFSSAHPEVAIEALHWIALDGDTSVLDYWIGGSPFGRWLADIASNSDVKQVKALAETATGTLYRVVQRMNPVVHLYRRLRLPLRFPMAVRAGVISWEVVATKSELDAILSFLGDRRLEVAVAAVRRELTESRLAGLTRSQRELLTEAMRAGYFAVPRAITLTDLAKRLGRSKSAVSESLAHVERKLLESSLRQAGLTL